MGLRTVVEDLRDPLPGERILHPDDAKKILRGRHLGTRSVLGIRYDHFVDPKLNPDLTFYQLQVMREGRNGKTVYSKVGAPTTMPDYQTNARLNRPDILLRASNTEKRTRQLEAGLAVAALGAAYGVKKAVSAYEARS